MTNRKEAGVADSHRRARKKQITPRSSRCLAPPARFLCDQGRDHRSWPQPFKGGGWAALVARAEGPRINHHHQTTNRSFVHIKR